MASFCAAWPTGQAAQKLAIGGIEGGAYWLRYQAPDGTKGTLPLLVGEQVV